MKWILIIAIVGHSPEHTALYCKHYRECSDAGKELATAAVEQWHLRPDAISYRVERIGAPAPSATP